MGSTTLVKVRSGGHSETCGGFDIASVDAGEAGYEWLDGEGQAVDDRANEESGEAEGEGDGRGAG